MVITLFTRAARKNIFRGNQWRSETTPVNEPRRFFNIVTVTVKASRLCFWGDGEGGEKILNVSTIVDN